MLLFSAFSLVACFYAAALWAALAGRARARGADGRVGSRRRHSERVHLPRAVAAGVEHAVDACAVQSDGVDAWAAFRCCDRGRFGALARRRVGGHGRQGSSSYSRRKFFNLSGGDTTELRASSKLLATTFRRHLIARGALLAVGSMALPLFTSHAVVLWIAFGLVLTSETIGRYLFFVSAVPKHLVSPYLGSEAA